MTNRVTFNLINSQVQQNIARNYSKLAKLQEHLSSGVRLQRPSDDPVDLTNDLQLRSDLDQLEQFKRNLNDGIAFLAVTESTAENTNELFQHARELGIQASNDTNTGSERQFILNEVRVVLDQLVSIANQTFKGSFIFAGTETKEQPFELRVGQDVITDNPVPANPPDATHTSLNTAALAAGTAQTIPVWDRTVTNSESTLPNPRGNANAYDIIPGSLSITGLTEGTDYEVDYVNGTITFLPPGAAATAQAAAGGIVIDYEWVRRNERDLDGAILRETEQGLVSRVNTTASEIFGDPNSVTSWDAMVRLMEGLHEDDGETIRNAISNLNEAFHRALSAQSTAGARANRFDSTVERNEDNFIENTRLLSELEDVDFAKTISDFLLQEAVHAASLQSGARVIQPTLANFL